MKRLLGMAIPLVLALHAETPPASWVDADTGHRVVRLTKEPGSASLYFNQNGYTADGKGLVYTTPEGISVLDLEKREARAVVKGRVRLIDAGRKTPRVITAAKGRCIGPIRRRGRRRRSATCRRGVRWRR